MRGLQGEKESQILLIIISKIKREKKKLLQMIVKKCHLFSMTMSCCGENVIVLF